MKRNALLLISGIIIISLFSCKWNIKKNENDTAETIKHSIMKAPFGTVDNMNVFLYTLTNKNGIAVKITNYGGIITSIIIPDRNGQQGDIVLGYDSLNQYVANNPYFGAIVGRYANRIAKGKFMLEGKTYKLAINNGNNSLHGGIKGFDKVVWESAELEDSTSVGLVLKYTSRDGEEGYPGKLVVTVTYLLNDDDELSTTIEAVTDQPSPVNLCNHTYFNLGGANTDILGHSLTLFADRFTEVNDELIPTGNLPAVKGTAMDFTSGNMIGSRIGKVKGGYDHNYVLNKKPGVLSMAAVLLDPKTGRQVEILTTEPGVQFYSGNFLDGSIKGKEGKVYQKHYGLCLETQHFPDSPNQHLFPNTILVPGVKYFAQTIYRFGVR